MISPMGNVESAFCLQDTSQAGGAKYVDSEPMFSRTRSETQAAARKKEAVHSDKRASGRHIINPSDSEAGRMGIENTYPERSKLDQPV